MKIAIAVVIVLVAVVALIIIIARRGIPRMQHYQFAHDFLPEQLFADPASVIIPLVAPDRTSPGGRDLLLALWESAGDPSGDESGLPHDGLDFTMEVFGHPNSTACLIQLPTPLKKPEAYFAAIVFDGPGLALGTPRQLRYFVLEYHGDDHGTAKTLLGEWSPEDNGTLKYSEHGSDTPPDMRAFTSRVRQIVEESGSMPAPLSDETAA